MNIRLHIEELALEGFSATERYRIGEAVQQELARLLLEQGLPGAATRGGEAAYLDGGSFELESQSNSRQIGGEIAQAIYKGLNL
jgi:hypothetical protein